MPGLEPGALALGGLLAAAGIFMLGAVVKGTMGVGMPLVALPLLSLLVPAPRAMGLLVVPVLLSNLWQAWQAGKLGSLRRYTGLVVAQLVALVLTVRLSQNMSVQGFDKGVALGVLIAVALMALRPPRLLPGQERWAGPLVGVAAGVLGGVSSLTGPVLITYLMALRLPREEFVGSISILYLFASFPMYGAMLWWGRFGWSEVGWSVVALLPVFIGLKIGTALRQRISETGFRRLLFTFLCLLALMLLVK